MKSLLKNSRQGFITRVSYGMKNMVVLPEDSNSRSRGFTKPPKNFFFNKNKVCSSKNKPNHFTFTWKCFISKLFLHLLCACCEGTVAHSEVRDKIHTWAVLFQQVGSGLRLGLSNLMTGALTCWAIFLALDSQFCFIVIYMECTLQSQRWLIPETRVVVEL